MSKRDEYIEKMKQQLDELNAHIDELEVKAQASQEDLKKIAEAQITQLRGIYDGMKARLDELGDAGEEKWEALVAEGIEWSLVDNIHFDRASQNYPHTDASGMFAPNRADQINPDDPEIITFMTTSAKAD